MAAAVTRRRTVRTTARAGADEAPTRHQQELDVWQRQLWRECGLAIGRWLEQRGAASAGRLGKPIASLELHELEGMAWACVSRYGELREARRQELCLSPAPADPLKPDPLDVALSP